MSLIDVVVVTYRSREVIGECLDAAGRIPGLGRLIVVDHGDDDTAAMATAHGATVRVDPSNPGFGAGQNRGIAATESPFILILNPDATARPEAISAGVEILQHNPDVAAIQGVIIGPGGPERSQGRSHAPIHLFGRATGTRRLLRIGVVRSLARRVPAVSDHVERVPRQPTEVEALATTAVLVRREAFDAIGGFDQSFFLYGEDLDLCRRWRLAGWRLLALPDIWASHRSGASTASSWDRELYWWGGTMAYAAKWWSRRDWTLALGAAVIRAVGLAARRPSSAAAAWRSVVAAPLRVRRQRHGGDGERGL